MLAEPFVLPQAGGDISLRRVNQDGFSSEYLFGDATSEYRLKIRHTKTNVTASRPIAYNRHNLEVVQTIFAAGDVPQYERKFYFVLEHKPGDTSVALADAVCDKAIATSNALLVALLQWES
jgi:hypothetical protein